MTRSKKMGAKRSSGRGVTFETVRRLALRLPDVEEGLCYATPAFRVQKKLIARLWEDGGTLVVRTDFDTREALMAADPGTFFITDHYRGYPWILVRLERVEKSNLRRLLEDAWKKSASRRLLARLETGPKPRRV
jgi:hypothetical protein